MTRHPPPRNAVPQPSLRRHWLAGATGVVATVVFHGLLLAPIILGTARHKTRIPDRQGAGASAIVSAQEPVMTLILINETVVTQNHKESDADLASRGFAPAKFLVSIASPDPMPAFDIRDAESEKDNLVPTPEATGDQSGHALLFGRYMGQIKARIERAWRRPRTPIGAGVFACRVQITQDRYGNTDETTLQHCNGSARWQLSLVQAIQSASPLPAPPDPSVFADVLTLEFESQGFVGRGNAEGFEPETPAMLAAASAVRSNDQLKQFGERESNSGAQRNTAPIQLDLGRYSATDVLEGKLEHAGSRPDPPTGRR